MRTLAAFSLILALTSCGGGSKSPTNPGGNNTGGGGENPGSTTNSITVGDNFFDPSATTVPVGTTVTWTWTGSLNHNVTFDNGNVGNSGTKTEGTFVKTFSAAGTFAYHCSVHGLGMSGTIKVQ